MFRRKKNKKEELKKKQKVTLAKMKANRQLDSDNLREIIKSKLEWARAEKLRGESAIKQMQIQIARLDGIIMFIKDLMLPAEINKVEKEK